MKKQTKVLFWSMGLAAAAYAGYKYWKFVQEEKKLEEKTVSFEEIKAQKEAAALEERLKEREEKLHTDVSDAENSEDSPWYRNEYDQLERKLTREEYMYGAEYDMLTEDLVEYRDDDGEWRRVVRKKDKIQLLNSRNRREIEDIIISVDEMGEQIESLRKLDMEYEKNIYEDDNESLDYYIALLLDKHGITDTLLREKLITLSTYEFLPNLTNTHNQSVMDDLSHARKEYFAKATPNNEWVSILEVILYYAGKLSEESDVTIESVIENILENMGFDYDDRDVVINDIIISYFEHNRRDRPNADGTFGIFGITQTQYDECLSLFDEYQCCLKNYIDLYSDSTSGDIV